MSLGNAPTIRDNLAFYFDAQNLAKSFVGAPTTNYITYPLADWNGSSFALTYDYKGPTNDASYTYVTGVPNPVNAPGVLQYYTGTNTEYKYWALRGTVPSSGTYTFSYYARIVGGTGNDGINNGQIWRNTGTDQSPSGTMNPTFSRTWTRYSATSTVTSYLDFFPVHGGTVQGGYTLQFCGFQLEPLSFVTPFTQTSRSSTQSLKDMMGIHTIPATSLTYSANNLVSFVGSSSNKVTGTMPSGYTGTANTLARSWEVLVKPTASHGTAGLFGHVTGAGCTYYCNGGICINSGNYAFNWYDNSAYQFLDSGVAATSGVGAHIIGTWDPNDLKTRIYVNGVLRATYGSTTNLNYNGSTNEFQMGYLSASANYFTGNIDIAKYYYGKTLNAAEVKQNFNAVRGRYGL